MQHHLILIREVDEPLAGSGCCGRVDEEFPGHPGPGDSPGDAAPHSRTGDASGTGGGARPPATDAADRRFLFPQRRELMNRFGTLYRAVKAEHGEEVRISVVDPRNQVSLIPMIVRDALRYRVPPLTALQAILAAGVCSAVFDGQLLFRREVPPVERVLELIRGRLRITRVGASTPRV